MEKQTIKLTTKQVEIIQSILGIKKKLSDEWAAVELRENEIVTVICESAGITPSVGIEFKDNTLVVPIPPKVEKVEEIKEVEAEVVA